MGRTYELLIINDTSTPQADWMARKGTDGSYTIDVGFSGADEHSAFYPGIGYLAGQLFGLVQQGATFQNCVFTTHGAPGVIKFGTDELTSYGWYSQFYSRGFFRLFSSPNARVYFAGCQCAAGSAGWKFLEAAARSLVRGAGGWAFAWTSNGWKIPFMSHPKHFSGDVRQVYVSPGGDYLRFYDGGNLIADEQGFPVRPIDRD
jgi:hypothetical protein